MVLAKPERTTNGIKSKLAARYSQKMGNNLRCSKNKYIINHCRLEVKDITEIFIASYTKTKVYS